MPDPREVNAWANEPAGREVIDGEFGREVQSLDVDDSEGANAFDPLPDLPDDDGPRVQDWDHSHDLELDDIEPAP